MGRILSRSQKMEVITVCRAVQHHKKTCWILQSTRENTNLMDTQQKREEREVRAVYAGLEEIEPVLRKAIWHNVIDRIPYEYFNIPIGRQGFYKLRNQFLSAVNQRLEDECF